MKTSLIENLVLDGAGNEVGQSNVTKIFRATVAQITDRGEIIVHSAAHPDGSFSCDVLNAGSCFSLEAGDSVLVLGPSDAEVRGVVLGLVTPYVPMSAKPGLAQKLELEAVESVSMKCGESSIEMRKDGKVLIKGKDIVSHAKRVQRIKGGSVAIN